MHSGVLVVEFAPQTRKISRKVENSANERLSACDYILADATRCFIYLIYSSMILKGGFPMNDIDSGERNPSTALKLSSLCTGLGHIYCGRFTMGLVLCFLSLMPVPFFMAAVISQVPIVIILGILLPCALAIIIYIYAMISSYRLAKKIGKNYELKDYNNSTVYALFIVGSIFFTVTIVITVALYVRANVLEAFYCPAESMCPAIIKGDRFLVNKLMQRKQPCRGDIVVFIAPENRDIYFVKRVIGLPGDSVAVRGNDVYVNGQKLVHQQMSESAQASNLEKTQNLALESNGESNYQIQFVYNSEKPVDFPETKIPVGNCFVLGDNRNKSSDSRKFGFVPLGDILGKAEYIYYPASSWSRFGNIEK